MTHPESGRESAVTLTSRTLAGRATCGALLAAMLVVGLFSGGCVGYAVYPPMEGMSGFKNPNSDPLPALMTESVRWVSTRYPPTAAQEWTAPPSITPGEPPKFVVNLPAGDGQAFFDDRPVSQTELATALQAAARANPETEVQLRADQGVNYGRVVEVMGEAQKAGLNRIGFVADAPTTPATPGAQPPAPAASQ